MSSGAGVKKVTPFSSGVNNKVSTLGGETGRSQSHKNLLIFRPIFIHKILLIVCVNATIERQCNVVPT